MTETLRKGLTAARVWSSLQAHLCAQQLWPDHIASSGVADLIEVDAYRHGLSTLGPSQECEHSFAVNGELDPLHQAARLPDDLSTQPTVAAEDPLDVVRELLEATAVRQRRGRPLRSPERVTAR